DYETHVAFHSHLVYCLTASRVHFFFLLKTSLFIYTLFPYTTLFRSCKLLMLICILTKNVITSCSVTMMLFLHLEVKPLMTLTTVLYLSCALISGHLAMMLMELTKRR